MTWDLFFNVLREFGFAAAALVALVVLAWPFLRRWLTARVEAQVEEGVRTRLANHQLGLDKDLERFRKELEHESDRARALLSKQGTDFSIYAQRRHDAISRLFEEFLRLEVLATSFDDIRVPLSQNLETSQLIDFIGRLQLSPEEGVTVQKLFQDSKFEEVDHRLANAAKKLTRLRVGQARNDAYEAYYRAALYLPDSIDHAAEAVRDHFHMAIIPYDVVTPESGTKIFENRKTLRSLMVQLQNCARKELSGSAAQA